MIVKGAGVSPVALVQYAPCAMCNFCERQNRTTINGIWQFKMQYYMMRVEGNIYFIDCADMAVNEGSYSRAVFIGCADRERPARVEIILRVDDEKD